MNFLKTKIKNLGPRDVAAFAAVLTGIVWLLFAGLLKLSGRLPLSWGMLALLGVGGVLCSYGIVLYLFRFYIYRKVKLIYKLIHKHKLKPGAQPPPRPAGRDALDEVEREVGAWIEQRNEELDKLKSWQNYRRRFLGDISHELKTPIFNIQGYLDVLLDGGLEDPDINRRYLERAAKNVERLSVIVQDLEIISRMESGELLLDKCKFDLNELVEEVFEDMEIKAAEKQISLSVKAGSLHPCKVYADKDNIRRVLLNLVNNSIKYGREGGATTIGFYDMERHVLVEVTDNGIGIAEKHLPRVFERFFRVDKSRSREQGGTGLGLAIVKHIIEAHGHNIHLRSTPGVGSTFSFTLDKAKVS